MILLRRNLLYIIVLELLVIDDDNLELFRLCGPCSVVVSVHGDAGEGDRGCTFCIPPKNCYNLIDSEVSDGEVEVDKVVEG
jgi:hypothetical protein